VETFRCRHGRVYPYVEGQPSAEPKAGPPVGRDATYTAWHELVLELGQRHTIPPDTKHWFQTGLERAIVSEFSSTSREEYDVFTDSDVRRATVVAR
jgi:D-lyxose ketol-isomerase